MRGFTVYVYVKGALEHLVRILKVQQLCVQKQAVRAIENIIIQGYLNFR
jgi:hypothetical protein